LLKLLLKAITAPVATELIIILLLPTSEAILPKGMDK
jgi:hypothetical protein